MKKLLCRYLLMGVSISLVLLTACSKGNIFSWTHSSGSGSNVQSLSSDAYTALRDKDYGKALEYFSKILESDPNNSEAIYGYSVAQLAESGLDISTIVSNLVSSGGTPSSAITGLATAISQVSGSSSLSSTNILPGTVLANLEKIKTAVNKVLGDKYLLKIARGKADGKIAPDNPDLNLNLAFCFILRAAMNLNDKIKFTSDYEVEVENTSDQIALNDAAKDIVRAYHRLLAVINKLNLSGSNAIITRIRDDVNKLFINYKAKLSVDADISVDYIMN